MALACGEPQVMAEAVERSLGILQRGRSPLVHTALGAATDEGARIDASSDGRRNIGEGLGRILGGVLARTGLSRVMIAGGDVYIRDAGSGKIELLRKTPAARDVLWMPIVGEVDSNTQWVKHFMREGDVDYKDGVITLRKRAAAVFPRGEADLRAFAEEVRAAGMYLALHSISGGIGKSDPRRIGAKPDPRLASWGEGKLVGAVDAKAATLRVRLAPGQVLPSEDERRGKFPSVGERGATIETNWLKVGEEIVRFDAAVRLADGAYELVRCRRGVGTTPAVAHPAATAVVGLYAPYGANFIPGNDTDLLAEMVAE